MSYTIDFRRKVISVRKAEGLTIRETAKQFRIGKASLVRWLKRPEPKNSTPRKRKLDKNALAKDVEQYPDAYQKERAERFGVCIARRLNFDYSICIKNRSSIVHPVSIFLRLA
ncbi:IS630 transposase-related protein [Candidatus Arsenophonus triatominarum]|uniref:IS630 transposase-related protein n=1 Tax=Candidatus Arsenophonus triatominarum TaxID=57911 RepID=UPI0009419E4D|nr:IS630 transposase-related protein [Candidatus Arsenophonus triatominarum]